jgi:hypothetical protein
MNLRNALPVLIYIGIALLLTMHPAMAATTSNGGGAGFFQPVVDFAVDFKTAVLLTIAPLCFLFWVGTVGAIVSNGGHINGLGWVMIGGAFGTTALLVADLVINKLASGALV